MRLRQDSRHDNLPQGICTHILAFPHPRYRHFLVYWHVVKMKLLRRKVGMEVLEEKVQAKHNPILSHRVPIAAKDGGYMVKYAMYGEDRVYSSYT